MADVCTEGLDTGFVALGYGKVAFLGIVQGITELLPVSSTAHMRIIPAFLGWRDPGSAFSAAMQLAALAAVVSYFWNDVYGLTVGAIGAVKRRDYSDETFRFCIWILLATLPILIAGSLLSKLLNTCNSPLRSLAAIGIAYIVMGMLLVFAKRLSQKFRDEKYAIKNIQIGTLPGVQVNVLSPFPRVETYVLGRKELYFFYGGQEDDVWRDIVLSLRDAHSEN